MTRLRFYEILLLSDVEKTAKQVKFPKLVTVIKGENDSGKSCLIKSLYTAFGATPNKVHPNWNKLNVVILVRFEIGGTQFCILKAGKQYSLFNAQDELIQGYTSITKGLGPAFAQLFDFQLQLTNSKTHEAEQATPAFLFLPFYFDQDHSWVDSWDSFENLQQFTAYRPAIAAFHTGIKPNEYYKAKAVKTAATDRLETVRKDRNVVNRVLEKIETLMRDAQFDLSVENYQSEIQRLLEQCNELRVAEEKLRDEMIQLENRRVSILRQIEITESAALELGKDFAFAADDLGDDVECPMCGQHYENSFAERFGIAADEDRMRALLIQLTDEKDECSSEIGRKEAEVAGIAERMKQISILLEVRQGEVRLRDVLRSEGKKEVRTVLRSELDDLNKHIGEIDDEIMRAEAEMKEWTAAKRTKEIKEFYQGKMSVHLQLLNVKELAEESYKEVHSRIRENGSDGPRALLAFYFAILKTIEKFSTTTRCPVVIDSPNQQEQDHHNWQAILEFMRDQRPTEAQMIVGLVDDLGIGLGGDVIELTDERQLLQTSEYERIAQILRPYIDKSLK